MSHLSTPGECKATFAFHGHVLRCTRKNLVHKRHECVWWDDEHGMIELRWVGR